MNIRPRLKNKGRHIMIILLGVPKVGLPSYLFANFLVPSFKKNLLS